MHATLPAKKCTRARACAPMQQCRSFVAMETIANLSRVLREHRAGCRLPPALLPSRRNQSPDAVRSRNPPKSTLAHDAGAAAVSHKHHSIIRVGAGLIQFVYGSHSKCGHGAHPSKNSILAILSREFYSGPKRLPRTVVHLLTTRYWSKHSTFGGLACIPGLSNFKERTQMEVQK